MQVIITAVGPDNRGLADPIIHSLTGLGANVAEIQMYDHDEESVFSMMTRVEIDRKSYPLVQDAMAGVTDTTGLSVRTWSPDIAGRKPKVAICVTYRQETPLALLRAMRDGMIKAEPTVMIGNRKKCRGLAEQFGVEWRQIGDDNGIPTMIN